MKKLRLNQTGFTTIEMIVVLPIVSFIAVGMTLFMINSFEHIQSESKITELRFNAQITLFNMEDELLFATGYGASETNDLNDPYEPTDGWSHNPSDSSLENLIILETSLTGPRRDPDRDFVYKPSGSYGCSYPQSIALDNVIYFTEPNDNGFNTLYRRVLTPQYSTCGDNYRGQTCPAQYVGISPCENADARLSENVIDFQIDYYDEDNNLIVNDSNPGDAEKVTVTLTLGDRVFGRDVESTASLTYKKIN